MLSLSITSQKWKQTTIMALAALFLVLLLQLPGIFGSAVFLQSKDCSAADSLAYSYSHDQELYYYINRNLVDRVSFCEALQLYIENGCDAKDYFGSINCALDVAFDNMHPKARRKLLQEDLSHKSRVHEFVSNPKPWPTAKVGIAAGGVLFVCYVLICPCIYAKRRKATAHAAVVSSDPNSSSSLVGNSVSSKIPGDCLPRVPPGPSRFSMSPKLKSIHLNLSLVVRATRNFSESLQIGEGGSATVYKAQLEEDGPIVAIKRAKREHFESLRTEFSSEVELLSKIDHRCLVKLLGYVDRGNEQLLITEYIPNGTLREHLDGLRERILDFHQRLAISIDVAHGLTYLHQYAEKQIIHRNVKSSNIFLTESMRAKVGDFGFARVAPTNSVRTHISTKVKGTVGYLDPEYMKTYQLTAKSDVYSFGILLLEIVTGCRPVELKKPVEERVTLTWAFRKYQEGRVMDLVDPLMNEAVDAEVMREMFGLAFQCAAPILTDRPDMKSVGEKLWTIRAKYLEVRSKTS